MRLEPRIRTKIDFFQLVSLSFPAYQRIKVSRTFLISFLTLLLACFGSRSQFFRGCGFWTNFLSEVHIAGHRGDESFLPLTEVSRWKPPWAVQFGHSLPFRLE